MNVNLFRLIAHERTLHTDILFGLLKNIQKIRNEKQSTLNIDEEEQSSLKKQKLLNGINKSTKNEEIKKKDFYNNNFSLIQKKRIGKLKLIIMSATLDAVMFEKYFK